MGSNSHDALGSRQLQGSWFRKGPLPTNRMSELLTYGSVGGVGRKPGPYPAANRRPAGHADGSDNLAAIVAADRVFPAAVAELGRSAYA
jgi:hypothetical protein